MNCYAVLTELVGDREVDLDITNEEGYLLSGSEIAYWRKFNSLHGWMQDLYFKKGGIDPEFNCNTVRLMPEDLDTLQVDAEQKNTQTDTRVLLW